MKGNGAKGKILLKGKGPNKFKARASNPKEISLRNGFFLKGANLRGMLVRSPGFKPGACFNYNEAGH